VGIGQRFETVKLYLYNRNYLTRADDSAVTFQRSLLPPTAADAMRRSGENGGFLLACQSALHRDEPGLRPTGRNRITFGDSHPSSPASIAATISLSRINVRDFAW
jgi:hypothetical protein